LEGNGLEGLLFIVCLLGLAGLKKIIDLPHERAVRARTGWREDAAHLAQAPRESGSPSTPQG